MKRMFDLVGGLTLLALSSPLFLITALAVKITSRGPVFFGQARCGLRGREFQCLKFRTMVVDAEDWLDRDPELRAAYQENDFKLPVHVDPRVTRIGRFLRSTHVDELPQLLNVLKGDMSLVGPRPITEEELVWYGDQAQALLSVRPGVFGSWTAQGNRRVRHPQRAALELEYVRDVSLLRYLSILLRHLPVLLKGQKVDDVLGVERPSAPSGRSREATRRETIQLERVS